MTATLADSLAVPNVAQVVTVPVCGAVAMAWSVTGPMAVAALFIKRPVEGRMTSLVPRAADTSRLMPATPLRLDAD